MRLDKGSGAEFRDGSLMCTRHGATFEPDSGACTHAVPARVYLEETDVTVHDGGV